MATPDIIGCIIIGLIFIAFLVVCFKCVMMDPKDHKSSHSDWAPPPGMSYDNINLGVSMEPGMFMYNRVIEPFNIAEQQKAFANTPDGNPAETENTEELMNTSTRRQLMVSIVEYLVARAKAGDTSAVVRYDHKSFDVALSEEMDGETMTATEGAIVPQIQKIVPQKTQCITFHVACQPSGDSKDFNIKENSK